MKPGSLIFASALIATLPVFAHAWTLEPETSTVVFGSIKNDYVGEAHTFSSVSGAVDETGAVEISIGLASVATRIDIRDERMIANIFGDTATATLTSAVDLPLLENMSPGESTLVEMEATLKLLGVETPLDIEMFVMRLSEDRVMASTNIPVYIATEDLEIDAGIDALQEIAGLDSITRVTPLTARLIFSR